MNKHSLKRWVVTSSLVISLAFTAACAKTNPGGSPSPDTSTSPSASPSEQPKEEVKNEKKHKISMLSFTYGNAPPKDGAGVDMLNEYFNIDYDATIIPYANYQEKLTTTISGGGLADVTVIEEYLIGGNLYKWAKQGAFLTLNDYIDKYPTLKMVPDDIWEAVTVDGNIFAIPTFYPQTPNNSYLIRKDWLDNLGLEIPTSYEELKKVAIAFTNDDPDGNGKNDTYGLAMSENGHPFYTFGPYWDALTFYHKNDAGEYIPGVIAEGRKQYVEFVRELYEAGAVTKDFGAIKNFADVQKDFYSGKAGVYGGGMIGLNQDYTKSLLAIDPNAELAAIPPFVAPDGSQGQTLQKGFYTMTVLDAKLKGDEDKIDRIMQIMEMSREYIPPEEKNPDNPVFDFLWGKVDAGYTMEDGKPTQLPEEEGKSPLNYLPFPRPWAPNIYAPDYPGSYTEPVTAKVSKQFEDIIRTHKGYVDPANLAQSNLLLSKGDELALNALAEQVKMMMGHTPMSDWDKMVNNYLDKGGADIIKEVNENLKGKDLSNLFKDMTE